MTEAQTDGRFYFVANRLCLDFVNTRVVENGEPVDLLGGFDDLVAWTAASGACEPARAKELLADWGGRREAERVFGEALALRDALRETADRVVAGRAVPQSTVDRINEAQSRHAGHVSLSRVGGTFVKRFHRRFDEPAHLLVPVAESASDLLSGADLSLVRRCENPACVLYFYDTTKNHARRWCSMSGCGNRVKVAAYYRRARRAKSG